MYMYMYIHIPLNTVSSTNTSTSMCMYMYILGLHYLFISLMQIQFPIQRNSLARVGQEWYVRLYVHMSNLTHDMCMCVQVSNLMCGN